MSKFDKFGLISGIVGLVADALALAAVFHFQQSGQNVSLSGWLLLPIAAIYGTLVVGFYYRKCSAEKYKRENQYSNSDDINTIEKGGKLLTKAVAVSLSVPYIVALCFKNQDELTIIGRLFVQSAMLWIIFALILGYFIASILNWIAYHM